jgi:peptidoglycan/LPS O-acetylase OafA/YrhL
MDLGVAIFFVLSGFLIYRPFARAHLDGTGATPLRTYLRRRVVRIVPAYWLALSVFWALGLIELGSWTQAWRFYVFLHIYDAETIFGGIVQAWSLGTELAFYLLVPVWAAFVVRVAGRRSGRPAFSAQLVGVGVLVAAGYVSRAAFSASDRIWSEPDVTMRAVSFTWLPNNIDLFALGMGLAVISLGVERGLVRRSLAEAAGRWPGLWWGGALAIFVWYAYRVGPPPFRVGHVGFTWQQRQLAFGAIGVALLVPAVFGDQGDGLIRRALRWPPVVAVGMVSYGMKEVPGWLDSPPGATNLAVLLAVGFGVGLGCAAISYYALERPLQLWRQRR